MKKEEYDIAVIGAGPGGYVAAIRAAQLGFKTVCIEKRETFGGACLNVGCIPSKALLQSSEYYAFLKDHAKEHGISCSNASVDFSVMMKRKEEVVKGLVAGVEGLLRKNHIATYQETAQFISPYEIQVPEAIIKAKHFILATGSASIELPFLKFDEKRVVSSTGALSLDAIPKKMIVIGGGVIGVELASVYNRLGSEVIIVEMLERICPAMDAAISKALLQTLKKQGVVFHLETQVLKAAAEKNAIQLGVKTKEKEWVLSGDVVLVSVGRRPYSESLQLEAIGIEKSKAGFVVVNRNFQTSQKHIYAIGDLIEGPMLAHRASQEGTTVVEMIAGLNPKINYAAIPNVIYTHPEAAAVGFTEEEAKSAGLQFFTGMCPLRGNARARCAGDVEGFVKIIGEKTSGKLLGLHIIGPYASEMIGEGVVALEKGVSVETLANVPHAHPTLSEAIKEACLDALGRAIHI